ncbi:hypothetical protein [Hymenobacter sp. DG25B]|uniref:hypothetical protein n=1 Tax=Hymenobacter sp. DG25B TaxID=1385664 RepID=UPI000AF52237|nr:hypothetical protein [Hymenobacter sp. DG25B]
MLEPSYRRQAVYYGLLFMMLMVLVPRAGHQGDVGYWANWASYILEHGLGNTYADPSNNYNPFYHYILWLFGKLLGNAERIRSYINSLKGFTLLFDFAGAIWAASLVAQRNRRFELSLLLLFNIAYLYNTLIWEQVDAIYTFWVFGAVVFAVQRKPVLSVMLYVLALATKTQAIIFMPPLLLLWLPLWWQRPQWIWKSVGAAALTSLLLLAPFIWGGTKNYLPHILDINRDAVDYAPVVAVNAYNFWHLLFQNVDLRFVSDAQHFAGLTYKGWGLLLFFGFSAITLFPLLASAVQSVLKWPRTQICLNPGPSIELVLLSCALIPLLFAFFNTQMHERYWHPAILFLGAYGFLTRSYWLYIAVSVAYFLNLESVLHFLKSKPYTITIMQPWFVATLFGLIILLGLVKLYASVKWPWTALPEPSASS